VGYRESPVSFAVMFVSVFLLSGDFLDQFWLVGNSAIR
jgi:hypothetical protein